MSDAGKTDFVITTLAEKLGSVAREKPDAKSLWVADEHPLPESCFNAIQKSKAFFLSNRFDQYNEAKQRSIPSYFSDIDLSETKDLGISEVFFRVAKERPLVHRLINEANALLPPGGTLWIAGYKQEGIKTHIARAESLFGCKANISRGPNQYLLAELALQNAADGQLDDNNYPNLREIQLNDISFWSKPGLYGWDKVDQGSALLMDWLAKQPDSLDGKTVLDLGCGFGYLSMRAAKQNAAEIVATDNCAAALVACNKNLSGLSTTAEVVPSDAGTEVCGDFDVILCNPPFHQGFSTTPQLHKTFLQQTKRLLRQGGNAWFVVNQFLNIEKPAADMGLLSKEVTRSTSYKIIQLST